MAGGARVDLRQHPARRAETAPLYPRCATTGLTGRPVAPGHWGAPAPRPEDHRRTDVARQRALPRPAATDRPDRPVPQATVRGERAGWPRPPGAVSPAMGVRRRGVTATSGAGLLPRYSSA